MKAYITQFIVYILAMTGALVIAYVVWKRALIVKNSSGSKNVNFEVVDSLRLPDRCTLYVINYDNQKFMVSVSDAKSSSIVRLDSSKNELNYDKKNNDAPTHSLLKKLSDNNSAKRGNY